MSRGKCLLLNIGGRLDGQRSADCKVEDGTLRVIGNQTASGILCRDAP